MSKKTEYEIAHKIAKLIVAIVVATLITVAQLSPLPISLVLNLVAVFIWFFTVNTVARILEVILGFKEKHDWF